MTDTATKPNAADVNSTLPQEELERLTQDIVGALKTVYDPEIPVDIYELGLIYKIDIADDRNIAIDMTLTAPACPVAGTLPPEVEQKVRDVPDVTNARVDVVWDPPWNPEMMSEGAKLELGFF